METKKVVLISLICLIGGVAVGRFTLPAKVVTKTETKEVIKYVEKKTTEKKRQENKNKDVVIVETIFPDGRKQKTTHIIDQGKITLDLTKKEEKTADTTKESSTEKTVEYSKNDWFISSLVSFSRLDTKPTYGVMVNRRILGPFYIGAFGITDKTIGGSFGVAF